MKGTSKIDALDIAILRELQNNSKQGYRDIALKIHTHPNTVMQRIKKLERDEVIKGYSADLDYSKLGYDLSVIVMIKVKKGQVGHIMQLEDVSSLPEVQALYAVTGSSDLVLLLQVKDRKHLAETLQKIQTNAIVIRTNTLMILFAYKEPNEFNPL